MYLFSAVCIQTIPSRANKESTPRDILGPLKAIPLSAQDLGEFIAESKSNPSLQKSLIRQRAIPLIVERLSTEDVSEAIVNILFDVLFVLAESDENAKEQLNQESVFCNVLAKLKDKFDSTPFLLSWSRLLTIISQYTQYDELLQTPACTSYFVESFNYGNEELTVNTIKILHNQCLRQFETPHQLLLDLNVLDTLIDDLPRKSLKVQTAILKLFLTVSASSETSKTCLTPAISPLMELLRADNEPIKSLILDIFSMLALHGGLRVLLEEEGLEDTARDIINSDRTTLEKHAKDVLVSMGVLEDEKHDGLASSGSILAGTGVVFSGGSKLLGGAYNATVHNVGSVVGTINGLTAPTTSVVSLLEVLRQAPQPAKIKLAKSLLRMVELDASVLAAPILVKSILEIGLLALSNVKEVILKILCRVAMHSTEIVKCIIPYTSFVVGLLCDNSTQAVAAEALWTFAFNPEFKGALQKNKDGIQLLEKLSESSDSEVAEKARGALFALTHVEPTPQLSKQGHVMISYNWAHQEIIKSIHSGLVSSGYSVWIDLEHMAGSTLEAMAHAVEEASVVLICFSAKYKDSVACRTEAEYAYKLQKTLIPLKVEKDFTPTGWLGAMLGTKLYYEFFTLDPDDISAKISKVAKELGERGKSSENFPIPNIPNVTTPAKQPPLETWSEEEIKTWLTQIGMEAYISAFQSHNITGKALKELQFIYLHLKSDSVSNLLAPFNMSLGHYLSFMNELRKLV